MNDRAKRKWLGLTCTTRMQMEKRFWEIVEGRGGEVEVMYGSDSDTSIYGSGFPRNGGPVPSLIDSEMWREYCSSPWNLNNLPKLPGSMLRAVHDNIAGVMVPWLYVGMLFSSFCWHVEDRCFYSMNYLHWYHFSFMGPPLVAAGMTTEYSCPFCLCMESGSITGPAGHPLICKGSRPETESFIELLSIANDFYEGVQEVALVRDIVKLAFECKSYMTEIVNHTLDHHDKDLSFISQSLQCALKAMAVAGIYDLQDGCKLESALFKNSWEIRVKKLLKGSKKPSILHIQRLSKEGLATGIPSTYHFMQEITDVNHICLKWADTAKKVVSDSGKLELSEVFKFLSEGESLPVHFEKEMKLLRHRSVAYCICQNPYDQRAMIACDQCDEWYHFDCINLLESPPACKPLNGEFITLPLPNLPQREINKHRWRTTHSTSLP